jgi:hypothetical protein
VWKLEVLPGSAVAGIDRDTAAINRVLDRLERAYAAGNLRQIAEAAHDRFVAVLAPAEPDGDAMVIGKKALLEMMAEASAQGALPTMHLFTQRDILVRQGDSASEAFVVATVKDRWPDGRQRESKELRLLVKQGGTWRLLLVTSMFWDEKILVLRTLSHSKAQIAGVQAGDTVAAYGGETTRHLSQFIRAIHRHFDDAPGTMIPLNVTRGTENLQLKVQPGLLGVVVETRLFSAAGAQMIGNLEPHPVKETAARMNDAVRRLNADQMLPELFPRGALAFLFTREGILFTDPANPRAGLEAIIQAMAPTCDWSTYQCDEIRALVQGPLAVVTCRGQVARAAGGEMTPFANAHLFGRQSGRWYWIAPLMDRVDIGDQDISRPDR